MTWTVSLDLQTHPDALRAVRRIIYAVVKQEGLPESDARELEICDRRGIKQCSDSCVFQRRWCTHR